MSKTKVWLVTGAGRGLGRSIALAAAEAGDRVVATVRRAGAAPTHDLITERTLDVGDRAGARAAVAEAVQDFGRLDVLVNDAGVGLIGAVEEIDEDSARQVLETNFLGALWLTQAALPTMRRQRAGHVVQISTVGGVGTMPTLGLYNAGKWALEAMSEALAGEVADSGIRVSIVEPGGLDTEWATASMRFAAPDPAYDGLRERVLGSATVPWDATGTGGGSSPEEAAAAIVAHVADPGDRRLRILVGHDAPAAVAAALTLRLDDYHRDDRFTQAWRAARDIP